MLIPVQVYIGYDSSESLAFAVLAHSIIRNASVPVAITPLYLPTLRSIHKRPRDPKQSTDFSFTRFLVPYLSGYSAQPVIYLDSDMLMLGDVAELIDSCDCLAAVCVVKQRHEPEEKTKNLGAEQTQYPMKNWSSVMVFWPAHAACRRLLPEYVDVSGGLHLHQFAWCGEPGGLPAEWNHLVGLTEDGPPGKCLHWTQGGPWWPEYTDVPYSDLWWEYHQSMESGGVTSYRSVNSG